MVPERQRCTALNSDFHHLNLLVPELSEMTVVMTQKIDPNRTLLRPFKKSHDVENGIVIHRPASPLSKEICAKPVDARRPRPSGKALGDGADARCFTLIGWRFHRLLPL